MTWHTHYLTEGAGTVARVIDTLPYHGPLLLSTNKTELSGARLSNLKCALRAERERSTEVTNEPYHLVLDVSDVCNLKCPLCVQATEPRGRKRTTLTVASAIKALSAFPGAVLRVEFFNWGEPFLNPEFLTIAQFADTAGIFSRTSSHFSIRNLPDANAIIDSGLKWVVLSIDGVTQETYEKYRVGGKLRQVLANLERLVQAKRRRRAVFPIVEWQFLALRHNLDEIQPAHNRARDLGVDVFRYGGARGEMANRIRVSDQENYSQSREYLLDGSDPLSEYDPNGQKLNQHEHDGCRWLWGKLAVHADGGVSPCWTSWQRHFDFGSIQEMPLDRIWREQNFTAARAAATGARNNTGPARLCEQCASCSAFVNAPERLSGWPTKQQIHHAAESLVAAGIGIDPSLQAEIESTCDH